jgi:hypothetical protein
MSPRTFRLIAVLACLLGIEARAGTRVSVYDPSTDKLVGDAPIAVIGPGRAAAGGTELKTGLSGESVDLESHVKLDPRWREVTLRVQKGNGGASMRVTYDPDAYFWRQTYDEATLLYTPLGVASRWRPQVVSDYGSEKGGLMSLDYATYRYYREIAEKQRLEGWRRYYGTLLTEAVNAVAKPGPRNILAPEEAESLQRVFSELVAADLKAPVAPGLAAQVGAAFGNIVQRQLGGSIDPRLRQILTTPVSPGYAARIQRVWAQPLRPEWLAAFRQGMTQLMEAGLGANSTPVMADELEPLLSDFMKYAEGVLERTGKAPVDAAWRSRLELACTARIDENLKRRIRALLSAPGDPDLLTMLERFFGVQLGRGGEDSRMLLGQLDIALRTAIGAGLFRPSDAAAAARIQQALAQVAEPLEKIYLAGFPTPAGIEESDYITSALQGLKDPGLSARLEAVLRNRVHPVVTLLAGQPGAIEAPSVVSEARTRERDKDRDRDKEKGLGTLLEDLIRKTRTEAPPPPPIVIPLGPS